jgi:S1-C subfamily serine protease
MTSSTSNAPSHLEQLSHGLADAVERAAAATVTVKARRRIPATGVVWQPGLVVTADHVIEQEDEIVVGLPDGSDVRATLAGRDPGSDLAALRVDSEAPPATLAPDGSARVGHLVLAVGRPSEGGAQASLGVVSAVGGPWRSRAGGEVEGYIRSDTTFFPGFSGGPLVDVEGRVLGINSSRFRPGSGITIPAAAVSRIVEALVSQGRIRRAYLGVGTQPVRLPAALAAQAGGQETGLLVMSVDEESPAGRAALLVGDILAAIDGMPLPDTESLQSALGPDRVGAASTLVLLRGGERREVQVALAERQ